MFKMAARASNENGKRGRGTRDGGLSYVNVTLPDVRGRGVCECVCGGPAAQVSRSNATAMSARDLNRPHNHLVE